MSRCYQEDAGALRLARATLVLLVAATSICPDPAAGFAPGQLTPTTFTITNNVGFGNSVFVRGNVEALGGDTNALSRKLAFNTGNVWQASIGLPPETTVTYRFMSRVDSAAQVPNNSNGTALTGDLTLYAPKLPQVQLAAERVLFYRSGWTAPVLEVQQPGGSFAQFPMENIGPGRGPGEFLFRAAGLGRAGLLSTFRVRDGVAGTAVDMLPGGVPYTTYADRALLQDGQLYTYVPAAAPSSSRIEVISNVVSPQGLLTRSLRVYLPRGYNEHSARRYPVLYMHDGNNIYGVTGSGFPTDRWNVDGTLNSLIRLAQVEEIIVVGIDNTSNRNSEYGPQLAGPAYLAFVRDTVKPLIDSTYRTKPGAEFTGVGGSSLGGLISTHFGLEAPNTFRRIGVFSPAYWYHTPTLNRLQNDASLPPWRIYLDSGNTGDASNDGFSNTVAARDHLLRRGLVLNRDVHYVLGGGDSHNEAAWRRRFPEAIRFLYPIEETTYELPDPLPLARAGDWSLYDRQP